MNVCKVTSFHPMNFTNNNHSTSNEYENPVSRRTERNLTILKALGGAAIAGTIVGGLTAFLAKEKKYSTIGFIAGAVTTLIMNLPEALYNTKVNAYAKQKEMDVFSRDKSLNTNLTEVVDNEIKDSEVSLDKKLNDNLKLQMANRGNALGVANITFLPQG